MTRPALLLSLTVLALLASAGGASACIVQGGGANPVGGEPSDPVHPGDPMQFSISKLDEGATYTVSVGDRSIVRDAVKRAGSGFGPVTERFTLPDYGPSPRSLVVSVHVVHAGGGTGHEDSLDHFLGAPALQYEPPAAAQSQPQSESRVEPPARAPSPVAAAPAPAPAATSPAARVRRTTRPDARAPRRVTTSAPRRAASTPATTPAARHGAAIAVAVTRAPATATAASSASRLHTRRHATVTARPIAPVTAPKRIGEDRVAAPTPAARATAAVPRTPHRHLPRTIAVALLALAALAGGALGGLAWRRRRRRSPDDGTDPGRALAIEAELQEILAEERAAHAERPPPTHALP